MKTRTKILIVGIDGLMIHRVIDSGRTMHLKSLRDTSYFVDTVVDMPTVSGPSWSTILTGQRQNVHGVIDNHFKNHKLADAPDLLTKALNSNSDLKTYAAAGWPPLIDPNDVGPVISDSRHLRFYNDGEKLGYLRVDEEVLNHALETIKTISPDLSFVYFCGVDEAGHKYGSVDTPYFDAAERIDGYLKRLHQLLVDSKDEWVLVVVTDHGHTDEGGHGGDSHQERASFVIGHGVNRDNPEWPDKLAPHELSDLILKLID